MRVGLQRDKVTDAKESATALATALDLDAKALTTALEGAGPKQFVEAQTLRKADYDAIEADLDGIPGLLAVDGTAPLAPTRDFARALLGGVGPATAEQVEKFNVSPGQDIGQWGLQQVFDPQLAGLPEVSVLIRDGETDVPVRTPQDPPGQAAARAADARSTATSSRPPSRRSPASTRKRRSSPLPALDRGHPRRRQPARSTQTYDRALLGAYAPGSTFKVISTAALLRDGVDPGRNRRVPRRRSSSTARRSRTSRAKRRAPRPSPTTSRSRATPRSSRSAHGCRPSALGEVGQGLRPRSQVRRCRRRRALAGPGRHEQGQPRRGDDRPGPHHRLTARHGRRRRQRSPTAAGAARALLAGDRNAGRPATPRRTNSPRCAT